MAFLPYSKPKKEDIMSLLSLLEGEPLPEKSEDYVVEPLFGTSLLPCRLCKVIDLTTLPVFGPKLDGLTSPFFTTFMTLDALLIGMNIGLELPKSSSQPFIDKEALTAEVPSKLELMVDQNNTLNAIVSLSFTVDDVYDEKKFTTTAGRVDRLLRSVKRGSSVYMEEEVRRAMDAINANLSPDIPVEEKDMLNARYLLGVLAGNGLSLLLEPTDVSSSKNSSNPRLKDFTVEGYLVSYSMEAIE